MQSLHLARHAREVVATDLNPRACDLARATFALNGLDIDVRDGSLYDPVAGEQFDLIVTNPPYVMSPPRDATLTYREAGLTSDDLVRQVVVEGADHLRPGGTMQVLANWVTTPDDPGRRVLDWLAGRVDVDVLVIERERLDAYAYIEMWLADAGLSGTDVWRPRYEEWLRYFDDLGVRDVSMGWIVIRRHATSGVEPYRRSESWPYAVNQPVGPSLADELDGIALSRGLSDAAVLDRAWVLRPDIEEERTQTPGATDPSSIVFRRREGMCRAYLASSTMAAVLGVCDGDLTVRQITAAVAALTDADPDVLIADVLGEFCGLIETGWFAPTSEEA